MKFTPHEYQRFAVDKLMELPEAGLFLDMGLGKTVITLTAVNRLLNEEFCVTRILVIAPKRVAESTWTTEAAKWDHLSGLTIATAVGSQKQRLDALREEKDVTVINRENVPWLVELYGAGWPFDMVVVDELSSFKSPQAKRFRALRKVRPLVRRFVGLTGTPTPNRLIDLWPQMYLIDRGERLGPTVTGYRQRFFIPGKANGYVVYSWDPKKGAEEKIRGLISDICVSMRAEDYLDMPELTVNDIPVQLASKELEVYHTLEKEQLLQIDDDEVSALSAATVYNKLLQMANGAVYADDGAVIRIHDRKLDALEDILDAANGQPVLVFYTFRHDFTRLAARFAPMHPRTLKGPEDIADWNEGRIPLLLAQPASMGHGLNLQAGGHIIVWYGLNWSLELYQQANARLYRQGQKQGVIIHRLVAHGTVDEEVAARLEKKGAVQESLLDALKARIRKARQTMDDSTYRLIMSLPSGTGLTVYYRYGEPSTYRIFDGAGGKKQLRSMLTGRRKTFSTMSELKRALGQPTGVRIMDPREGGLGDD